MAHQDPIADCFTRLRNAQMRKHLYADVKKSRTIENLLKIIQEEKFISKYREIQKEGQAFFRVSLRYFPNGNPMIDTLQRRSKVGRREYVGCKHIPRIKNGLGTTLISTSQGIMTGECAKKNRVGGEYLGYISS